MSSDADRIVIIGGGVIGLSAALAAAESGHHVTVIDPAIENYAEGSGASWMAGGMLAPVTEAWFGEEARLALDITALQAWPTFATKISHTAGQELLISRAGTIQIALDIDDARDLERVRTFQNSMGLKAEALSRDQLLDIEPLLSPQVVAGSLISTDLSVDNRALVNTLRLACAHSGVEFISQEVTSMNQLADRVTVVRTAAGDFPCDEIVIAAGAWSSHILKMVNTDSENEIPVIRPIRGEILRLKSEITAFRHTLRAHVHGFHVYLVPRSNGEVVVGATQFERGFDARPTAGGVYELLRDATELLPYVKEMEFLEARVGLRPGSPDNAPIIDRVPGVSNVILATGHYRNGILLTSIVGDLVSALLDHRDLPASASLVSLNRFSGVTR